MLLNNGKVLIAGGTNSTSGALSSAELYDPATGTVSVTGSMSCACGREATLLTSGMVLFSGGFNGSNAVSSAELYDPSRGTFVPTGSLNVARAGPSSTLLANGKVLIRGRRLLYRHPPYNLVAHYLASAELYDPATGTFALTGSLHTARSGQSATVLGNGNVLLAAGGNDNTQNSGYLSSATNPRWGSSQSREVGIGRVFFTRTCSPAGRFRSLPATISARLRMPNCTIPTVELSATRRV